MITLDRVFWISTEGASNLLNSVEILLGARHVQLLPATLGDPSGSFNGVYVTQTNGTGVFDGLDLFLFIKALDPK